MQALVRTDASLFFPATDVPFVLFPSACTMPKHRSQCRCFLGQKKREQLLLTKPKPAAGTVGGANRGLGSCALTAVISRSHQNFLFLFRIYSPSRAFPCTG